MNAVIQLLPLIAFIALGIVFAKRWIVDPPPKIQRYPKGIRIAALLLTCWMGTFISSTLSNQFGYILNDGIAYDEGLAVSYEAMHDGVISNIFNLFFGWSAGLVFWGVASALPRKPTEQDGALQPATRPASKAE